MKVQIVIVALATLLLPVHGGVMKRLQCAGGVPDNKGGIVYENSGFLTADFTQKACAAATGSINPIKKGNQKCCTIINFRNGRVKAFNDACNHQKAGSKYPNYQPFIRDC
ncbi:small cysteine-rich secretory protein SCR99 [Phytophthora cinnamomi]|uniref:small cysteine-rich secretory protein SCR99 n=1 Tax=Phytophthora cinnamomi TaxID=4785 RepID=UPI00355A6C1C|nr:small cysteine-rich secretory protein SCR99 [Phytophthora cinnamomi]